LLISTVTVKNILYLIRFFALVEINIWKIKIPHIHVSGFRSGDAMEDDISSAIKFCSTNNAGHGHGGMARQKIPIWANQ
jgi:hypothetical protein